MKKTLITLAALAVASVAMAGTTPDWDITAGPSEGLITYTTTLDGEFAIDLGEAAIKGNEAFTLTVTTTTTGFSNSWGTPMIGTQDANSGNDTDNFYIYVGSSTNQKVTLYTNTWNYSMTNLDYSGVPSSPSAETPLTLSFSVTWDPTAGDKGAITISSAEGSDVTGTAYTHTDIVTTFNYSSLTNVGTVDGSPLVAPNAVTTIAITKAGTLPTVPDAGQAIPEPATATLSLLALAGLAARRRRK